MVSRIEEFYVSIVRFCDLNLKMLWKIYATEFSYQTYHGFRCINIYDCVNGWANFSVKSTTLSAGEGDKSRHEYAVRAPPRSLPAPRRYVDLTRLQQGRLRFDWLRDCAYKLTTLVIPTSSVAWTCTELCCIT